MSSPDPKELAEALKKVDDDGIACPECGKKFDSAKSMKAHGSRAHGKKKAPAADKPPSSLPKRSAGRPSLERRLYEFAVSIGGMVALINPPDGHVILENAEEWAAAHYALAQESPSVRRALEALVATSAWGRVLAVNTSIALAILNNHGKDPITSLVGGRFDRGEVDPVVDSVA